MSRDLADTSEQKSKKTLEEVEYKCFLNDEEVPCRNMTFSVPDFCKPRAAVDNIRSSTMSCMLGTPARMNPTSERHEPKAKSETEKPYEE
tara:strand:- start:231 stop:500 length:270 start_codon:yes stop_codon:yes gene_type:complete